MLNETIKKRIIIIAVFVLMFSVLSFTLYSIFSQEPTCFDKKQNQKEKGIDCGGPCSPCKNVQATELLIQEISVVPAGTNLYDVIAKIYNPNDTMGAREFKYIFTLKDENGNVVATKDGTDFILPVDTKYVASLGIATQDNGIASSAEIVIIDPQWIELGSVEKPQLGVYNKIFNKAPMGEGSEVEGMIRNESNYDLNKIFLVIVLRDEKGKVLGINKTEKNVIRVKEQRDFKISWPYALSGNVQKVEVDVQSNVLDSQNFTMTR